MIAVLQYVKHASVYISKKNLFSDKLQNHVQDKNLIKINSIDNGLLIYLGICKHDTKHDLEFMVNKIINLKMIPNNNGSFGKQVKKVNPPILVVSEFTLCADIKHGSHVSFNTAMPKQEAYEVFLKFIEMLNQHVDVIKTGNFGADMQVMSENLGPISFVLNSKGYKI